MPATVYLRIRCDHLHLLHAESGRELERPAVKPFSNPRLLVAEFGVAAALLKQGLDELLPRRLLGMRWTPRLLIHPLERLEGGLSEVERRLLQELGLSGGAGKTLLHQGEALDAPGVLARFAG